MTRYLTANQVLRINRRLLGADLLADRGLLESACGRPRTTVGGVDAYPTLLEKAAALFESLARNHPFVDGNKRTAAVATLSFLAINGDPRQPTHRELVVVTLAAATGALHVDRLAHMIGDWPTP